MSYRANIVVVLAFLVTSSLLVLLLVVSNLNSNKSLELSEALERTNIMMKVLEEEKVFLDQLLELSESNPNSNAFDEELNHKLSRRNNLNRELKASADALPEFSDSLITLISGNEMAMSHFKPEIRKFGIDRKVDRQGLRKTVEEIFALSVKQEEAGRSKLRQYEAEQRKLVTRTIYTNRIYTVLGILLLIVMFHLIQRDFNRRKSEQLKLKRSNIQLINEVSRKTKELEEIIEKIHESYFVFNRQGECTYCNSQALAALSSTLEEVIGKKFAGVFKGWFSGKFGPSLLSSISWNGSISGELYVQVLDRFYMYSIYGISDGHVVMFYDVSEIRKVQEEIIRSNEKLVTLNQQLRNLSVYLQQVREDERDYISKEIHDHFGQLLTSLKLDLAWMENNSPPDHKQKVKEAIELLNEAIQSVRRISADLRPAILDDFGFIAALEWHVKNFGQKTKIEMNLDVGSGDFDFNKEISTGLFRIVQESLTNIFRHAKATRVKIRLAETGKTFRLTIADDGIGLSEDRKGSGIGLIGMKERAAALGGNLEILTGPEDGTTLTYTMELNDEMYRSR